MGRVSNISSATRSASLTRPISKSKSNGLQSKLTSGATCSGVSNNRATETLRIGKHLIRQTPRVIEREIDVVIHVLGVSRERQRLGFRQHVIP